MKKILLYTFAVLLVCAVVFGCMVVYSHKSAQSNLTLEQETDNLGVMPLSIDNIVEFAPGLRFRIDTLDFRPPAYHKRFNDGRRCVY